VPLWGKKDTRGAGFGHPTKQEKEQNNDT